MRLLLDTHVAAWWWADHPALPAEARAAIADPRNTVAVSAASAWEVGIKHQAGRWPEAAPLLAGWDALMAAAGFDALPISAAHGLRAAVLDWDHRDPFDRVLIAQAEIEGFQLATADGLLLRRWPDRVFWAG